MAKTLLKGRTLPELQSLFEEMGEPKYRAEQVFNWLYNHKVFSFGEMENLPKSLRILLDEKFSLLSLEKVKEEKSGSSGPPRPASAIEAARLAAPTDTPSVRETCCIVA